MRIKYYKIISLLFCLILITGSLAACAKSNADAASAKSISNTNPTVTIHNETSYTYKNITLTYNKKDSQKLDLLESQNSVTVPLETSSVDSGRLLSIQISCETLHGEKVSNSFSGIIPSNLSFALSADENSQIFITSNIEENN